MYSRDPYQCSPLSAAQLGVLVGILSGLSVSVFLRRLRGCEFCGVASSYLHLILVSSCETLPPSLQALGSPVGASAFVALGYPSLFLSYSFFLGAGGRAYVFCSFVFYPLFRCILYHMLLLLYGITAIFLPQHTCFLFLPSYPIRSSLPSLPPCLAWLCRGYRRSRCSLSVLCLSGVRASPRTSVRTQFFTFQGNSFVSLVPQGF